MKLLNRILNVVPLLGVMMLTIPLWMIFLGGRFPNSMLILTVCAIISTGFGYFIQGIFCARINRSSDGYDRADVQTVTNFSIKHAIVPIIMFIILSIPVGFLFDVFMELQLQSGGVTYHDLIFDLYISVLFLASCIFGCVIWFYPVERFSNIYVLFAGGILFSIESLLLGLIRDNLGKGNSIFFSGVPFAIFVLCIFVVYNQSNLRKQYRGSVVAVITSSERLYNLLIVLIIFAGFLLVGALSYIVIGGLYVLIRAAFFMFLYFGLRKEYSKPDEITGYVPPDSRLESIREEMSKNVASGNDQLLVIVFMFVIAAAVLITIGIKTGYLKDVLIRIKDWIADVISTVFIGIDIIKSVDISPEDINLNYTDEKKSIANNIIKDYYELASSTNTYKDFVAKLDKMESYDEQLCYAYSVLLKLYRKMNISLKNSDTPREIKCKVKRAIISDEIEKITADFEKIRYAQEDIGSYEEEVVLKNICNTVKKYMF